MSNEYLKAADDAKRLLAGFKAVADVAEAFEKVGSLVQAEKEAQKSLAELRPELDKVKQQIADGKAKAAELVAAAEKRAEQVVADGQAQADALIASAKASAEKTQAEAGEYLARAKETVEVTNAEVAEAQAKRDGLATECQLLEGKLEKLKAQAAKLLGE